MSADGQAPHNPKIQGYLQAWGASIGRVLQEVAGAPHTWQELSAEATRALLASLKENNVGSPISGDPTLVREPGVLTVEEGRRTAGTVASGGAGGRKFGRE